MSPILVKSSPPLNLVPRKLNILLSLAVSAFTRIPSSIVLLRHKRVSGTLYQHDHILWFENQLLTLFILVPSGLFNIFNNPKF